MSLWPMKPLRAIAHAVAEWLPPASHLTTHRRGYNHSSDADDRRMLFDPEVGLAVCGDSPAGWRVKAALLSGVRVVDASCDSKGFTSGGAGVVITTLKHPKKIYDRFHQERRINLSNSHSKTCWHSKVWRLLRRRHTRISRIRPQASHGR
jgi:hypothetical protein